MIRCVVCWVMGQDTEAVWLAQLVQRRNTLLCDDCASVYAPAVTSLSRLTDSERLTGRVLPTLPRGGLKR